MKKLLKYGFVLLMVFTLVGCNDKKEEKKVEDATYKCKASSNDLVNGYKIESSYVIHAKGEVVEKVETVEKIISDNEDVLDLFKENIETTYKATNEAYGGYEYNVEINGNELVSKATIEYSNMNLEKFVEDNSVLASYVNNDKKLTVEGVKKLYTSLGATCE